MYSIIFFGTPEFALPSLQTLIDLEGVKITAVVTETDKPSGRGHKLKAPAVKRMALANGLRVLQPKSLRGIGAESAHSPASDDADALALAEIVHNEVLHLGITVAYGKIIPGPLLRAPQKGIINVHASLLPRWRGAAPLQRALLAGDEMTGVCIMQSEASLDTGPVFHDLHYRIDPHETYGSLHDSLASLGANALEESLPEILNGTREATAQATEGVTYAPKWTQEDCRINWSDSFVEIDRRVRACSPTPGARTQLENSALKIYAIEPAPSYSYPNSIPGEIVDVQRKKVIVACGETEFLSLSEIQLPGRKRMPIAAALQGYTFTKGTILQ